MSQYFEESYEDSDVCLRYLNYDILRKIFRYLNGRDLSSVAMVCRSWLEAANDEKCLRGPHYFISYPAIHCYEVRRIRNSLTLHFDYIKCNLTQLSIKPSIAFFLIPFYDPIIAPLFYNDIRGYKICELLPENCKIIMLFANTVILNRYHDICDYKNYKACDEISCAFLPQIPNVKISMVEVTGTSFRRNKYIEYMQMIEGAFRRDHKMSMCLMIFCNLSGYSMGLKMHYLAQMRLRNDKNTVFLCDGVMNGILTNNEVIGNYTPYCVALLITGSIRMWSVVMDKKYQTRDQFEEELKSFKEQVKLQKHSVCFVFGCNSVNEDHMNNSEKVVSFKRLFPELLLVGCLGICIDRISCPSTGRHNYCSIMFMILTYG